MKIKLTNYDNDSYIINMNEKLSYVITNLIKEKNLVRIRFFAENNVVWTDEMFPNIMKLEVLNYE